MYCSAILPATAVKGQCAVSATLLVPSQLEKPFFRSKTWVYYQYPNVDHGGIVAFYHMGNLSSEIQDPR
jgi:hypothetical protein